jgi:transcriptional regulator with GAF, ATPase, and Fis domain
LADVLAAEAMGRALSVSPVAPEEPPLAEADDEKQRIIAALRKTNGIVAGQRGAAHVLGMSHKRLRYRMNKYGIQRSKNA